MSTIPSLTEQIRAKSLTLKNVRENLRLLRTDLDHPRLPLDAFNRARANVDALRLQLDEAVRHMAAAAERADTHQLHCAYEREVDAAEVLTNELRNLQDERIRLEQLADTESTHGSDLAKAKRLLTKLSESGAAQEELRALLDSLFASAVPAEGSSDAVEPA